MPEVIAELEHTVTGDDGCIYIVNVCGAPIDNAWRAWLQFVPIDDSPPLLTPIETQQAGREDIAHWGATLKDVYIQSAFGRATASIERRVNTRLLNQPPSDTV